MIYDNQVPLTKDDFKALCAMWECCVSLSRIGDMRGARHVSKSIIFKYSPPDFQITFCVTCGHREAERRVGHTPVHFPWCALHIAEMSQEKDNDVQEIEELKKLFGVR